MDIDERYERLVVLKCFEFVEFMPYLTWSQGINIDQGGKLQIARTRALLYGEREREIPSTAVCQEPPESVVEDCCS